MHACLYMSKRKYKQQLPQSAWKCRLSYHSRMLRPLDQETTVTEKSLLFPAAKRVCTGASQEAERAGQRVGRNLPCGFRGKGKVLQLKEV